MTEAQRTSGDRAVSHAGSTEATAWVGWVLFAGIMLVLVGSFQFIAGLVAIFDDGYYVVAPRGLVVHMSYTGWGWLHMILGVLAAAAGYGVMAGRTWARVFAIILVSLSAIANLAFTAAYPVWGILFITIDVLVIWALAVHGREVVKTLD
jgi:hypothetical protein